MTKLDSAMVCAACLIILAAPFLWAWLHPASFIRFIWGI